MIMYKCEDEINTIQSISAKATGHYDTLRYTTIHEETIYISLYSISIVYLNMINLGGDMNASMLPERFYAAC